MPDRTEPSKSSIVSVRDAFLAGALLIAPLFVTILAVAKFVDLVGGTFRPFLFFSLPPSLRDRPGFGLVWDLLATVIVLALITLFGYLTRYVFGKFFFSIGERFVLGIPGIGTLYTTVKQIIDTFGSQGRPALNKVVLVEYPRKGTWTVGFLTNQSQGEAQSRTGREVWSVFIPTTPNPTSGFVIFFPREEVVELEMSVGDGMKLVISGGAFLPPWPCPPSPSTPKALSS